MGNVLTNVLWEAMYIEEYVNIIVDIHVIIVFIVDLIINILNSGVSIYVMKNALKILDLIMIDASDVAN